MKNKKVLIPFILFLLIVGATAVKSYLDKAENQRRATAALEAAKADTDMQTLMHNEYPGVPENNHFIRESAGEIIDRFEQGTGVIFLGFKECPWCQRTAPLLQQAAEAENLPIYYLDIRQERADMTLEYQNILSILSPYLRKNAEGQPIISTPDISFVKNGEIMGRFEMESTTESERTPDTYWTSEREERAIERFKDSMQAIK